MKRFTNIALLALLILCPTFSRAENDTLYYHDFAALSASHIKFTKNPSKVNIKAAIDDGVSYSCEDGASFGLDVSYGTIVCVNLPTSGEGVITSRISNLNKISVEYKPEKTLENIKFKLSTDSSSWGAALTGVNYEYCKATVEFPKGNYYVKFYLSDGEAVSIIKTWFIQTESCNCFPYAP